MDIKNLLDYGIKYLKDNNIEEADLKCKMLLSSLLNVRREYLVVHSEEQVDVAIDVIFKEKLNMLKKGKPIQYIISKQEFMGLNFYVDENVLIPQPDTEILVEEVILKMKQNVSKNVLDICTGSGAIAVSIAKKLKNIEVYASDISKEALEIAKKNAVSNMVNVEFILSNMFGNIDKKFDFIVSNPPYIEKAVISTLPEEVKYEPEIALDGGEDGLKFYRIIAKEAKRHLNVNGFVAVEIGYNQRVAVIKLFEEERYREIYSKKDFGGNDRIVVAKL